MCSADIEGRFSPFLSDDGSADFCHIELQKHLDTSPANDYGNAEFLAYMSHEMRTPLNAILGFTQILAMAEEHPKLVEKRSEYVHGIDQSAQRLLKVTVTMLSYLEKICEIEAQRKAKS